MEASDPAATAAAVVTSNTMSRSRGPLVPETQHQPPPPPPPPGLCGPEDDVVLVSVKVAILVPKAPESFLGGPRRGAAPTFTPFVFTQNAQISVEKWNIRDDLWGWGSLSPWAWQTGGGVAPLPLYDPRTVPTPLLVSHPAHQRPLWPRCSSPPHFHRHCTTS